MAAIAAKNRAFRAIAALWRPLARARRETMKTPRLRLRLSTPARRRAGMRKASHARMSHRSSIKKACVGERRRHDDGLRQPMSL